MEKNVKVMSMIVGIILTFWGIANGYADLSNRSEANAKENVEINKKIDQIETDRKEYIKERKQSDEKILESIDAVKDCLGDLNTSNAVMLVKLSNVKSQLNSIAKKIKD